MSKKDNNLRSIKLDVSIKNIVVIIILYRKTKNEKEGKVIYFYLNYLFTLFV